MVGRVLLLSAAVVVAGLGALLVYFYAQQADERAIAELEPVTVLVANRQVPAGTSVAEAESGGSFEQIDRPAAAVPDGALADTSQNADDVLLTDLYPGEVVLGQKLGDPGGQEGLGLQIPEGLIAASFTFGDPNRVADFIAPGSDVAVFLTTRTDTGAQATDPVTGGVTDTGAAETTRLLLPEVPVIAVGTTTTGTQTQTTPDGRQQTTEVNGALLTLGLSQEQLERLVLAQSLGELYLGLLTDTSVITPGTGVTLDSLFQEGAP